MTDLVSARIDQFRRLRRIQATSLIITVFGDAVLPRGGSVWLGSLIRLLEPLNLNDRLVRTSVFRLVKDAWLGAETVGRRSNYALTQSGRRRFEEASRQIYSSCSPVWDRHWRLILLVNDIDARQKEQLRRTLFWKGFGMVAGHCFIHPSADLTEALDALTAEGVEGVLPALMPMMAAGVESTLAASHEDLVARAWDLTKLAGDYAAFYADYQPLLDYLREHPLQEDAEESAFLLRILLIHDYRRLLLRDPELPEVLLPADWSGHRARLLCRALYKILEPLSDRHLDRIIRLADNSVPARDQTLHERFPALDSLTARQN